MKIPEKTPPWFKEFQGIPPKTLEFFAASKGREILSKINDEYLHWEKVKYQNVPKYVNPRHLWAIVKATRLQRTRAISLSSPSGKHFIYGLPDSVHKELHLFDRFAGGHIGLDAPEVPSGARERYLISSLMEEAIASSQLEGAATTRPVAKTMLRSGRKPKDRTEQMILNNYRTILKIKDLVSEPLSIDLLHRLQSLMTKNTLDDPSSAGRFRRPGEEIHVVDLDDGKSLYIPPPAEQLAERLEILCRFANNEEEGEFIHPVIKAVLLHFWLAYEHPYVDGNGRTARALFYWFAIKSGYWLMEYISISRIILRTRNQYYRSFLYTEGDDNDVTYFIVYNLRALNLAMGDLKSYLGRKQREYTESLIILRGWAGLNYRQQALLKHALANPSAFYTFQSHRNSHNVAYATARADLMDLAMMGLLLENKSGKQFVFIVPHDLAERIGDGQI